ncbi:hypothetical protein [Streptomyces sp. NRRL F-5135]|uniref:hypothetical protein n=1 Tax=Streptomyces sp. NRRL F-5135 TaxID=1463858 RepID=UPI00131C6E41|nr:hypothetical protein [Streptomyces sp. NRRL F-5135]
MKLEDKRILIIGAGEVGNAVAEDLVNRSDPAEIIIHTSRQRTMDMRISHLKEMAGPRTLLTGSWGDIFAPYELTRRSRSEINDRNVRLALAEFFLQPSGAAQLRRTTIYELISRHRPHIIIDAVNSASVCTYTEDPHQTYGELLDLARGTGCSRSAEAPAELPAVTPDIADVATDALLSLSTPILHRYVDSLRRAMADFQVERFIKVSTTGLGGMGYNCPYTHGSVTESGLSGALVGKIGSAGVLHQLLWNLHHTAGCDVRLVIPAALIGWESVRHGAYTSRGRPVAVQDCARPLPLHLDRPLGEHAAASSVTEPAAEDEPSAEMVHVPAGDNSTYSRAEMSLSTALGQFESVTREEVAAVVLDTLLGSTRFDLFTAMDTASLQPSYLAAQMRTSTLTAMRQLEKAYDRPSIVSGNLGPTISKDLLELHVLCTAAGSLEQVRTMSTPVLASSASALVREDVYLRQQALSIGLAVLLPDDQWLAGPHLSVPSRIDPEAKVTRADIDDWSRQGWVDLRPARVLHWQENLRRIEQDASAGKTAFALDDTAYDVGEVLAYHYKLTGQARRIKGL